MEKFHTYTHRDVDYDLEKWRWYTAYDKKSLELANNHDYYQRLIENLKYREHLHISGFDDYSSKPKPDVNQVYLRHDVDIDIHSMEALSTTLWNQGTIGSFYILHTAPYYGEFDTEALEFKRHHNISKLLLPVEEKHGNEVALHVDALGVYQNYDFNGIQAIKSELEWLRSIGLSIRGTSAHNAATTYGAENFEIFKGRSFQGREEISINGKSVPLGVVNEADLGLTYEANEGVSLAAPSESDLNYYLNFQTNDPSRSEEWMRLFLLDNPMFNWRADYNIWLVGRDKWVLSGNRRDDPVYKPEATLEDVISFVDNLSLGNKLVFHIHPFYIGLPNEIHQSRLLPMTEASRQVKQHGRTYLQREVKEIIDPKARMDMRVLKIRYGNRPDYDSKLELSSAVRSVIVNNIFLSEEKLGIPYDKNMFDVIIIEGFFSNISFNLWDSMYSEIWRALNHHGWLINSESEDEIKNTILSQNQDIKQEISDSALHEYLKDLLYKQQFMNLEVHHVDIKNNILLFSKKKRQLIVKGVKEIEWESS